MLVHRANPERRIRELRYSNNDASALIRISPVNVATGAPTATIVRQLPRVRPVPGRLTLL